jgi:small conductance mechanosensitive channel
MEEELDFLQTHGERIVAYLAANGVRMAVALAILVGGFFLGRFFADLIQRTCAKRQIDITLSRFFAGSARLLVILFAAVIAVSKVGIEIAPFIALFGAGAFGLSLAVQGPLSNYGAGIVIIVTRPFKVGDTLRVQEVSGVVDLIALGQTRLIAEDGEHITIPNRKILGEILTNSFAFRVIEGEIGIAYDDDPERGIAAIEEALRAIPELSAEKPPEVGILRFGESSIDLGFRVWAPSQRYFKTLHAVNLAVFQAVKGAGLTIPFPQREVSVRIRSAAKADAPDSP